LKRYKEQRFTRDYSINYYCYDVVDHRLKCWLCSACMFLIEIGHGNIAFLQSYHLLRNHYIVVSSRGVLNSLTIDNSEMQKAIRYMSDTFCNLHTSSTIRPKLSFLRNLHVRSDTLRYNKTITLQTWLNQIYKITNCLYKFIWSSIVSYNNSFLSSSSYHWFYFFARPRNVICVIWNKYKKLILQSNNCIEIHSENYIGY
jgi:hypothetical protein